jgi:hypothetical protein
MAAIRAPSIDFAARTAPGHARNDFLINLNYNPLIQPGANICSAWSALFMSSQFKAIALFAGMIVLPVVADNLISRRPDVPLFRSFPWAGAVLLLVIILVALFVIGWNAFWKFKDDIEGIQGNLKLAERELTKIVADNWDQAGRIGKVRERAEWASMANPSIFPSLFHILKDDKATPKDAKLIAVAEDPTKWSSNAPRPMPEGQPLISQGQAQCQVGHAYPQEFGKLAEAAFELNKTDMANRGAAIGKATMTAILLRSLYQGSPGGAIKKLSHEIALGGSPFVAPGLRQLLDFEHIGQDGHAPVDWIMLTLAVEHGKFPKELRLLEKGQLFQGWIVIKKLTEPAPPEGEKWTSIPDTPKDITMLQLWWKWLTWWE